MLILDPRSAAIADRIVPNARVTADSPAAAGAVVRQWQAAHDGALAAFAEKEAAR